MKDPGSIASEILAVRSNVPVKQAALVGITGIDGSGKGYVTSRITRALLAMGIRVAAINIDGWLNLPPVRFSSSAPAENFYLRAIRFEEMFAQLVFPLRERRSVHVEADFAEETAVEYRRHLYEFEDVDVILLEGIYLLKRAFQGYYDMSVWIDCGFDTALERAISRAQEGLSSEETVKAYRSIYFPAQQIHFQRDEPRSAATAVVDNDAAPERDESSGVFGLAYR